MNSDTLNFMEAFDFSRLTLSISVLIFAFILAKLSKLLSLRLTKSFPDYRLRMEQITTLINFVLIIGSIILAAFLLFRSKEAALAIGGSIGLAFAIGAKDIAASLLSGLIVMFDRSFRVGDRIKFDDLYGDVITIGVRSTRIRTLDDSIVTVPNSQFMNQPVISANAGSLDMQVEVEFFIAPDSDLSLVEKLVREAAIASRRIFLEKPVVILFKDQINMNMFYTRVLLKAYVVEVIYEKPFESEVTERVHLAFKQHSVEGPRR